MTDSAQMESCIIVLDNGAGYIKAGVAGEPLPRIISPNLSFKARGEMRYTPGDALLTREDILSLSIRRPFDRGYLVNGELQKEIWTKLFKTHLKLDPVHCGLVITEPLFNFDASHSDILKIIFEGVGFESVVLKTSAELALLYAQSLDLDSLSNCAKTGVIVDVGFSFSHIVPICNGDIVHEAVRRIDFGGKAMTNYFKELISFRSLHLMDETYLAETIKNSLCFVSQDIRADLAASKQKTWASPFYKEFVLPDGVTNLRGFVRHQPKAGEEISKDALSKEQILTVNTERFMVTEVLFHPSDIGLNQAGLPEAIVRAVSHTPKIFHPLLYENVILIGGMAQCPGFASRLRTELRPLVDDTLYLRVVELENPVEAAWKGGSLLGHSTLYTNQRLTRHQYLSRNQTK